MYTYTVRPTGAKIYTPMQNGFALTGGGCELVIRKFNKVVKTFPHLTSEKKAHQAAKLWLTLKGVL